jgi:hypothetical protein
MTPHHFHQIAVALQEQADAFGVMFLGHQSYFPKVNGAPFESLDDHFSAKSGVLQQWQCLEYPRIQAIVWIPTLKVFGLAVGL